MNTWNPAPGQQSTIINAGDELKAIEGAWANHETQSRHYAKMVGDELVMPYCYGGNDYLTSVYYGWKKVGEFWFARFYWLTNGLSGFAFLKPESADRLAGAWWTSDELIDMPEVPNLGSGVSFRWVRLGDTRFPDWALKFLDDVKREGIVNRLAPRRSGYASKGRYFG